MNYGIFLVLLAECLATKLAVTYMWHLQQPIYWPAYSHYNKAQYQFAWESIQTKSQQGNHPQNDVAGIFSVDDRIAIYQYRAADSISSVSTSAAPKFGAQMSYPGDLMENVNSIGAQNAYGYSPSWNQRYTQYRQQKTSGGFPKLDLIGFPYHHTMSPLVQPQAFLKDILIQQIGIQKYFGQGSVSKGFFPAEMAFSERIIPSLVQAGYEWVIVPNTHLSRAVSNYQWSKYGDNNTPPNPSDQVNPAQQNWYKMSISRGVTTNNAYPFSYTPHYAQYIDPNTGQATKIIVVPSAMGMSWQDGYSCYSTNDMDQIANAADPNHPELIVLAHDGDNAFGGGYSYYMECVQNLINQCVSKGYEPTTIQQYLHDYPVDPNDIIHVEDGAWVNADGDFGDPTFVNWNWPLFLKNGTFDVPNGWSDKQRDYAIATATANWVETAEAVTGPCRLEQIQDPQSDATYAEIAWHHYLPSLASDYLYYGTGTLDMCDKTTIACNPAVDYAKLALSSSYKDTTPPSVWSPYRLPYNPGGYQYGSLSNYQYVLQPTDFWIYTFVYDVSGVSKVSLWVRKDLDGKKSITENFNEVYECNTAYVTQWEEYQMFDRPFPGGNYYSETGNCFANLVELPEVIADEYYVKVTGFKNALLDYYIEAEDKYGNVFKSDIYHVYVASGQSTEENFSYHYE
jgi:Glycosyl hydrolase family 57